MSWKNPQDWQTKRIAESQVLELLEKTDELNLENRQLRKKLRDHDKLPNSLNIAVEKLRNWRNSFTSVQAGKNLMIWKLLRRSGLTRSIARLKIATNVAEQSLATRDMGARNFRKGKLTG